MVRELGDSGNTTVKSVYGFGDRDRDRVAAQGGGRAGRASQETGAKGKAHAKALRQGRVCGVEDGREGKTPGRRRGLGGGMTGKKGLLSAGL